MISTLEWVNHLKTIINDPKDINKLLEKTYNAIVIGASISDILNLLDLCTVLKGANRK